MGIINITTDSFYQNSASVDSRAIADRAAALIADGADMIDVGAYSTRPGCTEVSVDDELRRLDIGIAAIHQVSADIPVSVDTFRAEVARKAVSEMSADIINDISGGNIDPEMFSTVADLKVPYILTHSQGQIDELHQRCDYHDLIADEVKALAARITALQLLGVNDIIIDPGFGFSKDLEQNYRLLKHLDVFKCFHKPILVGVSRKSMITKVLNVSTDDALNGTTVLNTYALLKGASILRVHDVKEARQAIALVSRLVSTDSLHSTESEYPILQ